MRERKMTDGGTYTLLDRAEVPYLSETAGRWGGHRRLRIYGRLDCPSALRALARGQYARHRVFFADEDTALGAGYRPCAICMPAAYRKWKVRQDPLPDAHSEAELSALLGLLTESGTPVRSVSLGHSRDSASREAARAFAAAWEKAGGDVVAVADWPEGAASWLRPARRLTAHQPDAWVVAAAPAGFVELTRRLDETGSWSASRTYAFGSLCGPRLMDLADGDVVQGLSGATADGGIWYVSDGELVRRRALPTPRDP